MDKKIKVIDLHNIADDGKDYYFVVLNLNDKNYFLVKYPSCLANVEHYLADTYSIPIGWVHSNFKIIWNGNSETPDFARIPKKYHKYFN